MKVTHYKEVKFEQVGNGTDYVLGITVEIETNSYPKDMPEIVGKPRSIVLMSAVDWRMGDVGVELKIEEEDRFVRWLWNAAAETNEDAKTFAQCEECLRKSDRERALEEVLESWIDEQIEHGAVAEYQSATFGAHYA